MPRLQPDFRFHSARCHILSLISDITSMIYFHSTATSLPSPNCKFSPRLVVLLLNRSTNESYQKSDLYQFVLEINWDRYYGD